MNGGIKMDNRFLLPMMYLSLIVLYQNSDAQNITASYKMDEIDSLVNIIDSDAELLYVKSDSVTYAGTSVSWNYIYRNQDDVCYYYHTTYNNVIYDSTDTLSIIGPSNITKSWIDSDSALYLAEEQGGNDFRSTNIHYKITACLSQSLNLDRKLSWFITYISLDNPDNEIHLTIDAEKEVSAITNGNNQTYPINYLLLYNYPNPFNPVTVFSYQLQEDTHVELSIFDINGRIVDKIVSQFQLSGCYSILWDATDFSSGVYLYKIQVGNLQQTEKCLLMK